jgi:aerobic-type carbon monoxide dehydrogenase small subunit (CoxS/CutS family)
MAAVDLLRRTNSPTDADIDAIENICRCGTYGRIRQAIKAAAVRMQGSHVAERSDAPVVTGSPA